MSKGWIKLHRSLLDWEWYDDHNATRLLVHLLISVNYEEKKWKGIIIPKGSIICSWSNLADAVGFTEMQCRTAMKKLEKSGEVTRKVTNKYQLVSLSKWEKFQLDCNDVTDKASVKQQTDNRQITTTKEYKENKEINNYPTIDEFVSYAQKKASTLQITLDIQKVKTKYLAWSDNDWYTSGDKPRKIKNWKTTLTNSLQYMKGKPKSFVIDQHLGQSY